MKFNLLLEPQTETKCIALSEGKGVTADELVRWAIHKMITEAPERKPPELPVWHPGGAGAIHRRDIYDDAL